MGKIIGIVPATDPIDPAQYNMSDKYHLGNNYIKRAYEAGCTPIGLTPADNRIGEDVLDLCDGFLVQGGADFYAYHFQVIHHAITKGKRYLGVCLGHQLIYAYLELKRRVEAEGYEGDLLHGIWNYIQAHGGSDFSVLNKVPGHRSASMPRGQEDVAKHDISIAPGTMLHKLLGKETARIATFHYLAIPPEQTDLTVNAWSADGVVEGVELGNHILGIQGHPEVDNLMPEIFTFLNP